MKGRLTAAGPMYCNRALNHWFRHMWRHWTGWCVVLASLVLFCGCSAATSSTASPSPTAAGTSEVSVAASSPSPATSAPPSPSVPARIVAKRRLAERKEDLTIESPAVGGQVKVRLLLPVHYETEKTRLWPVLYLLHGCCDSYVSWTRSTDIEQLTQRSDILVVMPDGGKVGFYSDWQSGPGWETFHTTELPRVLAQQYRASTVAAVAGVSMGGLGALDYAARHPGMFTIAASFSGIVHTRLSNEESQGYLGLIQSQGEDPQALWGNPDANVDPWKQHNPYDLAPQLKGVRLFISAGNGRPGPLDGAPTNEDSIETSIGAENRAFVRRVRQLGLDAQIDLYGPGTHNWVYWQRELHRAWPLISDGLGLQ
jgi:diacylglycerol O-acyltransferase/trehalose O-mycolyltransferase